MSDEIMTMKYEFFSWKGFLAGALVISVALVLQSLISFPDIWLTRTFGYSALIISSALIVGISSGSVLVFLFPPDQDVIGVAGLGSEDLTQHIALFLVILALVQPIFSGFVFFFEYFGDDPLVVIWVLVGFAAPSVGFAVSMYDRTRAIANDLEIYFSQHKKLDMASLDWLHGLGPRTAVYRMGMLENAATRVKGLRVRGHEIIKESDQFAINK
ncbi:MAG: hypothetical protein KAR33_00050 [Candidatus Thorarchaeota archaeon]|nr:hypothetical protein [Candidatus Thorarchaeota archaeon]